MTKSRGAFRDFILAQPVDMPVAEVVALGKKAGLKFSPTTVRTSRDRARKRQARAPTTRLKDLKARVRAGEDLSEAQTPEPEATPEPEPTTAAAFVRSMPVDMPVEEVMEKGAKAGLNVTVGTVYSARSLARRREAEGGPHPAYPVPSITREAAQKKKKLGPHGYGRSPAREFVRSLPLDVSSDEVIARAEAAGLTLAKRQVHQTRFDMRRRQGKQGPQEAPRATWSAARVSRASGKAEAPGDAARAAKRQAFKALILELGMDDAESIWEDFAAIRNGIRR